MKSRMLYARGHLDWPRAAIPARRHMLTPSCTQKLGGGRGRARQLFGDGDQSGPPHLMVFNQNQGYLALFIWMSAKRW